MSNRETVTPKIIELNNTNDIYMTMNIAILSEDVNLNNAQFTSDFIEGVVENKEKYVGLPFLVNREKIENGELDNLTHELDTATGELKTDQIGSFVDFWKEEIDGANCLMGSIRIFKRFSETCSAIVSLVEENALETSCEVLVKDYLEITETGVRKIHYNNGNNTLIGSAIVTHGAEVRAKPTLLIAEAYKKDIESSQQGGEIVEKEYNNGIKVEYFGEIETSSLKFDEIEKSIYNSINPVDVENGGRDYNYWIHTLYHDKVILEDAKSYKLYAAGYKIINDTVIVDKQEDWVKGSFQFVSEGVSVNELMEQNSEKIKELQRELTELKEEKETMSKKQEATVEELNEKIESLEKKTADLEEKNKQLEETIVSQKEKLVKFEEIEKELNEQIDDLTKYKEQVEKAERETKMAELNEKYSKLLSEETFKSQEVSEAIENLDEAKLNSIVVAEIAKEVEEPKEKVEIAASTQEDLVTTVKDSSYWSSPKSN